MRVRPGGGISDRRGAMILRTRKISRGALDVQSFP